MPTLETRLDRLRLVYCRPDPEPEPPSVDPDALTFREQVALDDLLARVGRRPNGRADFGDLSDAEFDRFDDLYRRYTGAPSGAA